MPHVQYSFTTQHADAPEISQPPEEIVKVILSLRHGFIYFAMPKTATTSIESILTPVGDITLIRTESNKHINCCDLRDRYSRLFSTYYPYEAFFKFGVVREPVSWLLSWYNFRSRPELADPTHPRHANYLGNHTFDSFIDSIESARPNRFAGIGTQAGFYRLEDGRVGVDVLLRHDHLQDDIAAIAHRLPANLASALRNTHTNKSAPRLTLNDVSHSTRDRILELFREDRALYELAPSTLAADIAPWDSSRSREALSLIGDEYACDVRETKRAKILSAAQRLKRSVLPNVR